MRGVMASVRRLRAAIGRISPVASYSGYVHAPPPQGAAQTLQSVVILS